MVLAVWVMLPMPPVPETVMVFPLVLMLICWVPLKDRVPMVPPTVSPMVHPWVWKVMVLLAEVVRVRIAAVFMATAFQ